MADATTPSKTLVIEPSTVDLKAEAVCEFRVNPKRTDVKWTRHPEIGQIDDNGVYTSPKEKLPVPQKVIVTATAQTGESGTAAIEFTDAPARILQLGWYAIAMNLLLGVGILFAWARLYERPVSFVVVNPLVVTLDPANEQDSKFTFSATVVGGDQNSIIWSASEGEIDSTGTLKRPADPKPTDKLIAVTAKSSTNSALAGSASVHLNSGKHFEITPPITSMFSGQQLQFRLSNSAAVKWSVNPSDIATISADGVLTARSVDRTTFVQVTASDGSSQLAAIGILVSGGATAKFGDWRWILFVIMCGSLGSMIYYTASFVNYVGNTTFRASWFWFYISRPFVGGALALIFFFIIGSGFVTGTTSGDLMKVAMVSALVGLFSDKAVKKLSDILDVLLATKDDRKDKVDEGKKPSQQSSDASESRTVASPPPNSTAVLPKITSFKPASISQNADASIEIEGSGFLGDFKVKINDDEATAIQPSEKSFGVKITAAQASPPSVKITVTTAQGSASIDVPVT